MTIDYPRVLLNKSKFIVFYKPPNWNVTVGNNNNYFKELSSTEKKNKLDPNFSDTLSFPLFVEQFLKNKKYDYDLNHLNICHRLDKDTSGGILVVKDKNDHQYCRNVISDKVNTIKVYVTLVNGIIKQKSGFIKNKIACDKKHKPVFCFSNDLDFKYGMVTCSYYNVIAEYKFI